MTMTIQLEAPSVTALEAEAAALGLTKEQLAKDILDRHLAERSRARVSGDFKAALADSARENEELLRRLAR